MSNELNKLKLNGEKIKEYGDPVPMYQTLEYRNYFLTYTNERTVCGLQKTLAISRLDKKYVNISDLPELNRVFGKPRITYSRNYPNRGLTILYIY